MATLKKALNYVENAGGNATRKSFMDDYAPIGHILLSEIEWLGYVTADEEEHLHLTEEGKLKLKKLNNND